MTDQEVLRVVLAMGQESLSPDKYDELEKCILWIALDMLK